MNNICTPYDVKKYTPADDSYSKDLICLCTHRTERVAFSKCYLGLDFYEKVLEAVAPLEADNYKSSLTYAKDAKVFYSDIIYVSDIDGNNSSPDDGNWSIQKKFTDTEIQDLWDNGGMKYWLTGMVFYNTIGYNAVKSSAKGVVKMKDDKAGFESVERLELIDYKKKALKDANDSLDLLLAYMKRKGIKFGASSESDGCSCNGTCSNCRPTRRRRFHF